MVDVRETNNSRAASVSCYYDFFVVVVVQCDCVCRLPSLGSHEESGKNTKKRE